VQNSGVTWLGEVPSRWQTAPLKRAFTRVKRVPKHDAGIVTAFRDGQVTLRANRRSDGYTEADDYSGYQGIVPGDLAIHSMDAFAGAIGVSDSQGMSSPVLSVCTANDENDPRYMAYQLRLMSARGWIEALSRSVRERTSEFRWAEAGNQKIALPPVEEQRAIANFLDHELLKIDLLLDTYQRFESVLSERWKAKLKTALDPLAGDNEPLLFQAVPHHWRAGHLKHFADVVLGKMVEKRDTDANSEMFPYLRAASIQRYGEIRLEDAYSMPFSTSELNKYSLRRDDVVVVEGGSIGRAALVQETLTGWGFQNSVNRLRPKRGVHGAYLAFVMQYIEMSGIYKTIVNTSTISHLTAEKLQVVRVAFPQFDEQLKLSQALKVQLDGLKKASLDVQKFKALLTERRSALIDAAVTGKIDVRGNK
jgi:type I restriction enzyme S subunit